MKGMSLRRGWRQDLTQWGSSWRRGRVPVETTGMQKPHLREERIRPGKDNRDAKTAKELWKSVEKSKATTRL